MSGEFLGTFENSVHKHRVIIPAPFKKKFNPAAKMNVIVTLGWNKKIFIYPLDNWNEKKQRASVDDKSRRLFKLLQDFAMHEQELEKNGRIRIAEDLLNIADIRENEKVIIKGEGDVISLQNPERFEEEREKKLKLHQETFDEMDYML